MALTTYDQIQDTIRRYAWDRNDLSGLIPDAIAMTEARLNNMLRVSQMETSASVTITSGTGSTPSDYLAWRQVLTTDSPVRTLKWVEPDYAELHYYGVTATALADHFTIYGTTIKTYPPSTSNLTIRYYQKIPALASNMTGNWVTSRSPGLYIYGALMELSPLLGDDDKLTTWGTLFDRAVTELKQSDASGRYAKPAMRVSGWVP